MSSSESFNICDYLNLDMFEDDVTEDIDTMEASQEFGYSTASHKFLETDVLHTDPASLSQRAMVIQRAVQAHLQATLPYDSVLFQDTTNAPQALPELEATLTARANVLQEEGEKVANGADVHCKAVANQSEPSKDKAEYEGPSSGDDGSLPQAIPTISPTPFTTESTPSFITPSRGSQRSSFYEETSTSLGSNKENAPLAHPSIADQRSGPVIQPIQTRAAARRQHQEEEPVAGPSSVTLDDLESYESTGSESEEEPATPTKRPRSTNKEVTSLQTAARGVSMCGLDGGNCKHELTDVPKKNKAHIKEKHPSLIPHTAGTAASTTGPLYRNKKLQTDTQIRDLVERGALACTWAGAPGGKSCGSAFVGNSAQGSLARHVEEIHWGRKFACDECTSESLRPFSSFRALQKHKEKHRRAGGADVPEGGEGDDKDGGPEEDEEERPTKRRRLG